MSTKITKKIVVNSPGEDIIFDGLDFVDDATVEITAAASVTFKNCRFYNVALNDDGVLPLIGNATQKKKEAGYKLVIENCYFGKTGTYNMISVGRLMHDGSSFSHNYCTGDCSRDDRFSFFFTEKGATYDFVHNTFENYHHNNIQCSVYDTPEFTMKVNNNHIGVPVEGIEHENRGVVRFRPTPNGTKSFAGITIIANGNKFDGNEDRIAFCQMKSAKDLVLTEENVPTYILNGVTTPIEIVDMRPVVAE